MEIKDQGIFRTFTFRKFSPTAPSSDHPFFLLPTPSEAKGIKITPTLSLSSDSSEISLQKDNEFPLKSRKTPQNSDMLLENMIKAYKTHKSLPQSHISNLSLENCKLIVEKLLKEKLSLQEDLAIKENPRETEAERPDSVAAQQINAPVAKNQAFRALENVSPIERDDSDGHTNYKIVSLAMTPKEEVSPDFALDKLKKFENYKKVVTKLTAELRELTSYNNILGVILALEKDSESTQFNMQIKDKIDMYTSLSAEITEELKNLKKTIEPNIGFLEHMPLQRSELKILSKMIGYDRKSEIKPSEMQTLDRLLELYLETPSKKFEGFVDELLRGHDIAEIATIIVKYIKFLEEEAAVDLHSEALNCFITEYQNEVVLEDIIDQRLILMRQQNCLTSDIAKNAFEKSKAMRVQQIKIRGKPPAQEKHKWKLPVFLESLSGPDLYSKTLASFKKK